MDSKKADWGTRGSIYRYDTTEGPRWRFFFRDANGKQSQRRGFRSRREAQREREKLMGQVHDRKVIVSRETLAAWWESWLPSRKPYLELGTWNDYRRHGARRILPDLGPRKLTTITAPMIREWLVEHAESGEWAPKTLNNALTTLTVCLNAAVVDGPSSQPPSLVCGPSAADRSLPSRTPRMACQHGRGRCAVDGVRDLRRATRR